MFFLTAFVAFWDNLKTEKEASFFIKSQKSEGVNEFIKHKTCKTVKRVKEKGERF